MNSLARFRTSKSLPVVARALRFLVAEAARSVPYYKELFAAHGIAPCRVDSIEALRTLPITPRECLSDPPHARFLHESAREDRLRASYTSGSTGTPATIFLSKAELNYRRLLLFRAVRACFPRCLPFRVTDVGQVTAQETPHLTQRFGPIRLTRVPGNLPMLEQVRLYGRSAPQLLEGYAGCLELLAHELKGCKHYPKPRWLISRGEALPPAARGLLEEVFDCPVANFYNNEEVGNMAWECPDRQGFLHVNTDACIIELIDEHGAAVPPGVEGRVILTNLYNLTMPIIRHDIGDHATWDDPDPNPCTCGAATPTLASIDGRTDDFIILPDSRRVSPLVVLTAAVYACGRVTPEGIYRTQVRQLQVIQEKIGEAEVRVVPLGTLPFDLAERIERRFRGLHPEFRTRISVVEAIPLEPSGKLKRIISRVSL